MSPQKFIVSLTIIVLSLSFATVAFAASPVQLSVADPIQIVPADESVEGISLGLIHTVNDDMTGVNATFIINRLSGDMKGLQFGLVNFVAGEIWGYQEGFFNQVGGDYIGWQNGFINLNGSLTHGLQTGVYNRTASLRGVQFGIVNMTEVLSGIQVGLLNFNASGDPYGFLPIVNWSF